MKIFENNNIFKCGCYRKMLPEISKQIILNLINISSINENNLIPNKNIIEKKNNNIFINVPSSVDSLINDLNKFSLESNKQNEIDNNPNNNSINNVNSEKV